MPGLEYLDDGSSFDTGEIIPVLCRPDAGSHISFARDEAERRDIPFFLFNDIIYRTSNLEKVMIRAPYP